MAGAEANDAVRVRAFAAAVPETLWDAAKVAALTGADAGFIEEKVGATRRYILGPDETGTDLSARACRRLFAESGLRPEEVGLLVCVTQTPDYRIPHNSALLQQALGLPTSCAAFDLALGCSGFVYALTVCEGFMRSQGVRSALLVTCDPYSKIMLASDKDTMAVFGDAASATWLAPGPGARIGRADFGTDGGGARSLRVEAGGAALPLLSVHDAAPRCYDAERARLRMAGREVFNFVLSTVPGSIARCLALNGLALDEIDHFALHQGSRYMLEALAKRAGIPRGKLCVNIERYGNTVSSSVPLLLADLQTEGRLRPGTKVLVSGFGVGLSWGTNVLLF
jgi:3-oxoacyl-[acyl-carrier-protein] synthase-3